ncbi:MAG: dihydrodipicolinate synthase family protein [Planctomycetales bacterium]|nr:dihydrodipicolinate synthase family protein [Planctomycetales bacterium]
MPATIQGVIPVAHTAFDDGDEIDWPSIRRQIDWAYEVGADGFATGMVTELLRLTAAEREQLTRELGAMNEGRGAFVAGVGAESTRQAVQFAAAARDAGAAAVMAIPPISGAINDGHLTDYFTALLDVGLPVIVQDASSYVGRPIPLDVCRDLLERFGADRVLFKPEAAPLAPNVSKLRDATGGQARIFEGSGGISLIDSYRRGIAGTMPGMEFLEGIVAVWRALKAGDDARAYRVYFPICALVAIQLQAGLDGFLAIEKHVLQRRGLFATNRRRRPYNWDPDAETLAEVERLLSLLDEAVKTDLS